MDQNGQPNLKPDTISADMLVNVFEDGIQQGRKFCFIIGAGASKSSGIPTGQELGYLWIEWLDKNKD